MGMQGRIPRQMQDPPADAGKDETRQDKARRNLRDEKQEGGGEQPKRNRSSHSSQPSPDPMTAGNPFRKWNAASRCREKIDQSRERGRLSIRSVSAGQVSFRVGSGQVRHRRGLEEKN